MIEYLVQFNDKLLSLPAGVVVMLFALSLGYVLKAAEFFRNNRIPFVVVLFTTVMFPTVQFCADQIANVAKSGYHVPLNAMAGTVLGAFVWFCHRQFLKRWVDGRYFNQDGTKKFLKSDFPQTPQTTPPRDAAATDSKP